MKIHFYDFTGQLSSILLDTPAIVEEVTSAKGGILEIEAHPEKHKTSGIPMENHAKVGITNDDSSTSHISMTCTTSEKNDEKFCSENAQQVVSSETIACSGTLPLKNVASSSLVEQRGNDTSDKYEEKPANQERHSEDKHLKAGARDQGNDSKRVSRCK